MSRIRALVLGAVVAGACAGAALPALAQEAGGRARPEFLGIDLDNGSVYYNGRNSGRYCTYRTVERYNRRTGYWEPRRVRNCGRGLYLPE
ncbi:hypothetical protein MEX01_43500 [Methylorubrum extorquens]|uniref:hypothetical protein n=1 Tax=Methylorubrum extorquens TaxID=408 RepID=UPI00116C1555|nr:hypothetical protein [Methylorubrum extorquens]GEL43759.1 hypothetical protein MEX01_43500 [Methylorubrum extorquens]